MSRRLKEEYRGKGGSLCSVDQEEAFHRVLRKVLEWAMRRKVFVRSLMSLYVQTRVCGIWVVRGV